MLKTLKPNKNKQTQGYSPSHKGYDHSGKGDQNYYASFHGVVVQSKNSETKNWTNNGELTTADYGNYIKIKSNVDGKTIYQLGSHFKQGTVLPKGTEVQKGQVVAQIGNSGNSTNNHSHSEYMDESSNRFPVEFVDEEVEEKQKGMDKKQQYTEAYLGTRPDLPPSNDELSFRLQENKGLLDVIKSILESDKAAREYWLTEWKVETGDPLIDHKELAAKYVDAYNDLKSILRLPMSANTQEVEAKVQGLVNRNDELEKQLKTKVIYKTDGKEFETAFKFMNLRVIIERK